MVVAGAVAWCYPSHYSFLLLLLLGVSPITNRGEAEDADSIKHKAC